MSSESSKSSSKNPKLSALSEERKSGMPVKSSSEVAFQECEAIDAELAVLKVTYEQYFLGMERMPPARAHEDLKKRVERLKHSFVRNTAAKFRVQAIHAKFISYERLWLRTLQEIENGTYKRDLLKAKRRTNPAASTALPKTGTVDEVKPSTAAVAPLEPVPFRGVPSVAPLVPSVAPLVPSVAPLVPPVARATPASGSPARPAASSGPQLSDDKLKAVYDAYVSAKRRNNEDTSKMSYDSVAASLRKQVPELMKQHKAKAVEFKVVIKDGKALLKAVPK